jgi:hypothetical protein
MATSEYEKWRLADLEQQVAQLQEIAVRVKEGQLEYWPDASMTSIGRSLMEARRENIQLTQALENIIRCWADYAPSQPDKPAALKALQAAIELAAARTVE